MNIQQLPTEVSMDYEEDMIETLFNLLHIERGSAQVGNGYPGRFIVKLPQFISHINGEVAIAFNALYRKRKANFLCFDIDKDFEERFEIFVEVLKELKLEKATFATNGSRVGKGKFVIVLSKRMPKEQAIELLDKIMAKATEKGIDFTDKIDVFPTRGESREGGLVRILGRNINRNGRVEYILTLNGNIAGNLDFVEPYKFVMKKVAVPSKNKPSHWVEKHLTYGIKEDSNNDWVSKVAYDLARDAIRIKGDGLGDKKAFELYCQWIAQVLAKSAWLDETHDKSYALFSKPSEINRVFKAALVKKNEQFTPFRFIEVKNKKNNASHYVNAVVDKAYGSLPLVNYNSMKYSIAAVKLYQKLLELLQSECGLNRLAFSIDTERLGDYLGFSQQRACIVLKNAIAQGLILMVQEGTPHKKGIPGKPAVYCIVGPNDDMKALPELAEKQYQHYLKSIEKKEAKQEIKNTNVISLEQHRVQKQEMDDFSKLLFEANRKRRQEARTKSM